MRSGYKPLFDYGPNHFSWIQVIAVCGPATQKDETTLELWHTACCSVSGRTVLLEESLPLTVFTKLVLKNGNHLN